MVELLRREPEMSNRAIAERCGASHTYVNRVRRELAEVETTVETAFA